MISAAAIVFILVRRTNEARADGYAAVLINLNHEFKGLVSRLRSLLDERNEDGSAHRSSHFALTELLHRIRLFDVEQTHDTKDLVFDISNTLDKVVSDLDKEQEFSHQIEAIIEHIAQSLSALDTRLKIQGNRRGVPERRIQINVHELFENIKGLYPEIVIAVYGACIVYGDVAMIYALLYQLTRNALVHGSGPYKVHVFSDRVFVDNGPGKHHMELVAMGQKKAMRACMGGKFGTAMSSGKGLHDVMATADQYEIDFVLNFIPSGVRAEVKFPSSMLDVPANQVTSHEVLEGTCADRHVPELSQATELHSDVGACIDILPSEGASDGKVIDKAASDSKVVGKAASDSKVVAKAASSSKVANEAASDNKSIDKATSDNQLDDEEARIALMVIDDDKIARLQGPRILQKLTQCDKIVLSEEGTITDHPYLYVEGTCVPIVSDLAAWILKREQQGCKVIAVFDQNIELSAGECALGTDLIFELRNTFQMNTVFFIRSGNDMCDDEAFYKRKGADGMISKTYKLPRILHMINNHL